MSPDAELLRRFVDQQAGDAFTELVHRHVGLVHATALRRVGGDVHLAHDVTQTVFITLARKAPALLGHGSLAGWLYVSTQHAAAETVRGEQRRKQREAAAHSMQSADIPSDPAADLERLRPLLDDAIVTLKPEEREAVVLRFFEQRTFAEVGAALLVTEEAARKRVDRALEKLHGVLVRRGFTSTVAALGGALTAAGAGPVPASLAVQVAGTAVAQAASATVVVSSWLPAAAAAALIVAGSFVAVSQYRGNEATAASLAGSEELTRRIFSLRAENDRLARAIVTAESESLVVAPAPVAPVAPVAPKPRPVPVPRAVARSVQVTKEGAIHWEGEGISLREFLVRITAHQVATKGESQLTIAAEGANITQLYWVLNEAGKTNIKHLVVETDAVPERAPIAAPWTWF